MEGCGDQGIAAEAEDHAGGVGRPHPSEARPRRVEGEIGPGELGGNPHAHEHAEDGPGHRQHDADLDRVVIVAGLSIHLRFGRVCRRKHETQQDAAVYQHDHAMYSERIRFADTAIAIPAIAITSGIKNAYGRSLKVSCVIKTMPPRTVLVDHVASPTGEQVNSSVSSRTIVTRFRRNPRACIVEHRECPLE